MNNFVETLLTISRDEAKECSFYSLGWSSLSAWPAAGMGPWVRDSEFSLSLYSLLASRRPYTAESISQSPNIAINCINTNHLHLLIKGFGGKITEEKKGFVFIVITKHFGSGHQKRSDALPFGSWLEPLPSSSLSSSSPLKLCCLHPSLA